MLSLELLGPPASRAAVMEIGALRVPATVTVSRHRTCAPTDDTGRRSSQRTVFILKVKCERVQTT